MERVPDVGNPWLDAGIVPYSTLRYTTDPAYWEKWFPAELVLECFPGQFRNWFYALLSMSTMMEDRAPFRTLLGHGLVRDEKGDEMHKSKGNAIWFDDAAEQYGADSMRWLYAKQDPTQNLSFGPALLRDVRGGFLNQLWNTHAFFGNYARMEGYDPGAEAVPFEDRPDFDRWILTELQDTVAACRESIETYAHYDAARQIEAFVEALSNWYLRHNRKRFRAEAKDSRSAFQTMETCLRTLVRLLAPILPFTAEKLYQNLEATAREGALPSVHLAEYPKPSGERDVALTAAMRAVVRFTTLSVAARDVAKLKLRQPLQRLTITAATEADRAALVRFEAMLREELNVKEVELLPVGTASPVGLVVKPDFKALGPKVGDKMGAVTKAIGADATRIATELRRGADVVTVTVDGVPFELARADFLLQIVQPSGLAVAEDKGNWASVTTTITRELEIEGLMRDLLRRLMALRKEVGLEMADRVTLAWDTENADLVDVFASWSTTLQADLQADRFGREPGLDVEPIDVAGKALKVRLVKV
ncbi:MAG: DUF5915 domain-containing protein [Proteobacteria bacterium]|nr:DUF5915 domain-containing protein [Pseudomonadota bacterium]